MWVLIEFFPPHLPLGGRKAGSPWSAPFERTASLLHCLEKATYKNVKKTRIIWTMGMWRREKSTAKSQPIDVSRIKRIWLIGGWIPSCFQEQEWDFIDPASVLCLQPELHKPIQGRNLTLWISISKTDWGSLLALVAVWQPMSYLRSMHSAIHYRSGDLLTYLPWEFYSFQMMCWGNLRGKKPTAFGLWRWDETVLLAQRTSLHVFSWHQN